MNTPLIVGFAGLGYSLYVKRKWTNLERIDKLMKDTLSGCKCDKLERQLCKRCNGTGRVSNVKSDEII